MIYKTSSELSEYIRYMESLGYRKHHSCTHPGYVSRRAAGEVIDYNGRLGRGFKLLEPNWHSTRFCYVTYYLTDEEE